MNLKGQRCFGNNIFLFFRDGKMHISGFYWTVWTKCRHALGKEVDQINTKKLIFRLIDNENNCHSLHVLYLIHDTLCLVINKRYTNYVILQDILIVLQIMDSHLH